MNKRSKIKKGSPQSNALNEIFNKKPKCHLRYYNIELIQTTVENNNLWKYPLIITVGLNIPIKRHEAKQHSEPSNVESKIIRNVGSEDLPNIDTQEI